MWNHFIHSRVLKVHVAATLTNHDLFFCIKLLETEQSLSGTVGVGFAHFSGVEAKNAFLGLWAEHWLLGYELNL